VNELISISAQEYKLISQLVYDQFGINLGDKKKALVLGRLNKVVKQHGFQNFNQYYEYVLNDASGAGLSTLIDRVSTNHTFFNRENEHFDYYMTKVLPEMLTKPDVQKSKTIRIWSAGCSSGEEPYTLSMLALEYFGMKLSDWKVRILATDISVRALNKAQSGEYSEENIAKLPKMLQNKYFSKDREGNRVVSDKIREMVLFRRMNLMREKFPFRNKFHIIFCRNVMIYFDGSTRERLAEQFYNNMVPGGYLFIGHSESLGRSNQHFHYVKPAIYVRKG